MSLKSGQCQVVSSGSGSFQSSDPNAGVTVQVIVKLAPIRVNSTTADGVITTPLAMPDVRLTIAFLDLTSPANGGSGECLVPSLQTARATEGLVLSSGLPSSKGMVVNGTESQAELEFTLLTGCLRPRASSNWQVQLWGVEQDGSGFRNSSLPYEVVLRSVSVSLAERSQCQSVTSSAVQTNTQMTSSTSVKTSSALLLPLSPLVSIILLGLLA
ncbi:hypothetical protein BJ741DRAFT_590914 [Chytriomyces cf. hyalinus JEL632]|nr:hypothetical protein BJ741DRAFT_590914 [Chytriomyces cf. hyalinus JEL632]